MNDKKHLLFLLLMVAAVVLVDVASFMRLFTGAGIKVDENPLSGWPLVTGVLLFLAGLAAASWLYGQITWRPDDYRFDLKRIVLLALVMAGCAFFMLPMLSNDIFSVLAFGELALMGFNPYTEYRQIVGTSLFPYIGADCKIIPCLYGPLCVFFAMVSVWVGGSSPVAQVAVFKLIVLVASCLLIFVVTAIIRASNGPRLSRNAALILLSPVFWLQANGQAHTDIFVALWTVLIILLCLKRAFVWAAVVTGLSLGTKLTALIVLPYPFLVLFATYINEKRQIARFVRAGVLMAISAATVAAALYAPFWAGLATLYEPWNHLSAKAPLNCASQVISEGAYHTLKGLQYLSRSPAPLLERGFYESLLVNLFKVASITASLVLLWWHRRAASHIEVTNLYLKISTIAVCFFYPEFHTWYLMLPLCFTLYTQNEAWVRWTIAVTTFDNLLNITRFMDASAAPALAISGVVTVAAVLLSFYKLRERFLESGDLVKKESRWSANEER